MTKPSRKVPRKTMQELFASERNRDPFRLTILGYASLDQALIEAIDEAFGSKFPIHTIFKERIQLARALSLIPEELCDPLGRLETLRHEFAHGKLDQLTPGRAADLFTALKQIARSVDQPVPPLKNEEPLIILSALLLLVEQGLLASFEEARDQRAVLEEAMHDWWKRHPLTMLPLTPEESDWLFEETEPDAAAEDESDEDMPDSDI